MGRRVHGRTSQTGRASLLRELRVVPRPRADGGRDGAATGDRRFSLRVGRPHARQPLRAHAQFDAANRAWQLERPAERRHPRVHPECQQIPDRQQRALESGDGAQDDQIRGEETRARLIRKNGAAARPLHFLGLSPTRPNPCLTVYLQPPVKHPRIPRHTSKSGLLTPRRRNMRMRAALIGAFLTVAASGTLFGQGFQGGLRGSIKDPGGVVPGVEVTLTNEQTNTSRSTVTNGRGEYACANIDPGTYAVKATLAGYKTIDRRSIPIGTQQFLTLDLTMEVGAIQENITVTGQSPLIETSNASQGTVLDSAALQTLPSPGRAAFLIGTTVPTVIPTGDTQFNRQQDQTNASLLSLGGGTRRGNNYTLDGVPITDLRNRATANPSIESLEDMKVQVHTYDAEMGRTGGGVFNTTLKSGTNRFQGTAFFQTRPIWGQTNNFRSQKAGIAKPNSPYYLGGGAFGGPIKQNRTFFWFSTESYHDVQTRNIGVLMPTAAERGGDFSAATAGGRAVTIYDPVTKLPFANNVIPSNRINPVAAAMLKYLPMPDTNVDNGNPNYNPTSLINNQFEQLYSVKVEHKVTDKVSLSGFYLYNRTDEPCANYFGTADQTEPNRFADPNDYVLKRRPQIVAVNNTWVLSDSSVMALRFGWTTFPDNNPLTADFDPATLGFSPTYLGQITLKKFPQVNIRSGYNGQGRTFGAINPTEIGWKSWAGNGAFSKFVGTHTFKLGADYRRVGVDTFIPGDGAGFFEFDRH